MSFKIKPVLKLEIEVKTEIVQNMTNEPKNGQGWRLKFSF